MAIARQGKRDARASPVEMTDSLQDGVPGTTFAPAAMLRVPGRCRSGLFSAVFRQQSSRTRSVETPPQAYAMNAAQTDPTTGSQGPSAGAAKEPFDPPQPGLLDTARAIFSELPGLVSDRLDLLTLELKRAGRALALMVVLLVAAAILGVTAWLALWTGLGVGMVQLGLHWALSLLVVLLLNAGAALLAFLRMRALLPLLRLPATRRHLTPDSVAGAASPPAVPVASPAPAL
jgi:hypothetical protein